MCRTVSGAWVVVFSVHCFPPRWPNLLKLSRYLWRSWQHVHPALTVSKTSKKYKVDSLHSLSTSGIFQLKKIYSLIKTDADFEDYIRTVWDSWRKWQRVIHRLWTYYMSVPSQGSPFGTENHDRPYLQLTYCIPRRLVPGGPTPKHFPSWEDKKTWVYCASVGTMFLYILYI